MKISYWDCEFCNYEDFWDGEEEYRSYGCTHPNGDGFCDLRNKWGDDEDDCDLIEAVQVE